jgi:hypothetical protein
MTAFCRGAALQESIPTTRMTAFVRVQQVQKIQCSDGGFSGYGTSRKSARINGFGQVFSIETPGGSARVRAGCKRVQPFARMVHPIFASPFRLLRFRRYDHALL